MGTHPIFESDFDCLIEMSRRQLKKISGYDETAELMKAMGVDKDDLKETKPAKSRPKPKKAAFASFAAFDSAEDEEPEIEEEEKEIIETTPSPVQSSKSKKKRKKKKKKEDFDTILAEHGFKATEPAPTNDKSQNFSKSKSVLQIESKYLDADAELKRIFGSAAISADREMSNRNHQQQQRHRARLHRGVIINRSVAQNL